MGALTPRPEDSEEQEGGSNSLANHAHGRSVQPATPGLQRKSPSA
jgi:hypothetical protein